ncbi:MAG TPA: hypothetical protein VIL13_11715 [Longimicrobiales bacterium]
MNPIQTSRPGFALVLTVLISLAVGALVVAASTIGTNVSLVGDYYSRQDRLAAAADEGIELARARLNGDKDLLPESLYVAIEQDQPVLDGSGKPIPGVTRSTYVGPVGITSGQYGVYAMVVSVARDAGGATVIRRSQLMQESFSRFAYFTNFEGDIYFGGGDQIHGPLHTNDNIKIHSNGGAIFHGPVSTAKTISGKQYGQFKQGYRENAGVIPLPEVAELSKLRAQAIAGGMRIVGQTTSQPGRATTRIEFVAIDLNGDGDTNDEIEGFVRIYQSSDHAWVVAGDPEGSLRNSRNCGHYETNGRFVPAGQHSDDPNKNRNWGGGDLSPPHSWVASVSSNGNFRGPRCFLGGDPELFGRFTANDGRGQWLRWPGPVSQLLLDAGWAPDSAEYLWPLSRQLNPAFKGVIFVEGDVAVSGWVRGRVTLAATGDIIIADDLRYVHEPGGVSCKDILGLFAGGEVVVAYTPINAPWQRDNGAAYFSYDDTTAEYIHAFVLTLNSFGAQSHDRGSTKDEPCEPTKNWGRGCLFLTGGIIQRERGEVGTASGHGYVKRYQYDACGASQPPPYFPTTGRFSPAGYYEVDPNGFDVDDYFRFFTAGA